MKSTDEERQQICNHRVLGNFQHHCGVDHVVNILSHVTVAVVILSCQLCTPTRDGVQYYLTKIILVCSRTQQQSV